MESVDEEIKKHKHLASLKMQKKLELEEQRQGEATGRLEGARQVDSLSKEIIQVLTIDEHSL